MPVIVDDHVLADLLLERATGWIADEISRSAVYTTSGWYYRLAHAVHRGTGRGALSRRLQNLSVEQQRERVDDLPEWIGLIGARQLVPVMAALDTSRTLNMLAAEALALGVVTQSTIAVAVDAPLIREGCRELGLSYRLLS